MIMNAVFALHRGIMRVGLRNFVGSDSSRNLVNVHVGWHRLFEAAATYPEAGRYSTSILAGRLNV